MSRMMVNVNHFEIIKIKDRIYTPIELGEILETVNKLKQQVDELKQQVDKLKQQVDELKQLVPSGTRPN